MDELMKGGTGVGPEMGSSSLIYLAHFWPHPPDNAGAGGGGGGGEEATLLNDDDQSSEGESEPEDITAN